MKLPAIIAIIFMIFVFTIICIFAYIILTKEYRKTKKWVKIQGTCINCVKRKVADGTGFKTMQFPVVIYLYDDKEYTVISEIGYSLGTNLINKKYTVVCNPNNPNEATLNNKKNFWLIFLICFIITVLVMVYDLVKNII